MGSDTVLGVLVHFCGANLNFNGLPRCISHHGVQRLVAIAFGLGNIVIEFSAYWGELAVHPAQCRIAIWHIGHHNAQSADIENLLKRKRLAPHFFNNAVNVFGSAMHLGCDALAA